MAKITKSADRIGNFTRSANSAPPPVTADIRRPGDFRDGVAKAVAQGREQARARRAAVSDGFDAEGASPVAKTGPVTVAPAATIRELQDQVGRLVDVFKGMQGREPTAADAGFWTAYAQLVQAYEKRSGLPPADRMTEEVED